MRRLLGALGVNVDDLSLAEVLHLLRDGVGPVHARRKDGVPIKAPNGSWLVWEWGIQEGEVLAMTDEHGEAVCCVRTYAQPD